jgi:predicted HTH domain antitoxin
MDPAMRTVEIDEDVAALLESEQPLERAARETIVMDLFRRGKVSTGRACELLGLERAAFARRAADLGIPYFLMSKEDWEAEKATLDAWDQS